MIATIGVESKSEYELERGKPMPNKIHSLLQRRLTVYLSNQYAEQFEVFPELTFELPEENATPDLAICKIAPINFEQVKAREIDPPLGAVEIVSPSQTLSSFVLKAKKYFDFGMRSYWIVIPELKSIYVFNQSNEYKAFVKEGTVRDEVLGIEIPMEKIFGDIIV